MSCTPPIRTLTTVQRLVFSNGGNAPGTSGVFVLSDDEMVEVAPLLLGVRVTVIISNATPDFMSQVVLQWTDDGCTWSNPINLESSPVGDDRTLTLAWYTTTADFRRGIRVGVRASQEAGVNAIQFGYAQFIIDLQLRS